MGIKGLLPVVREYAPDAIQTYQLGEVGESQYRLAVDGYLNIHMSVAAIRSAGYDLCNDKGELTSHILGTLQKVINYVSAGITPIYVFDGGRHDLKGVARQSRKERLENALIKTDTLDPHTREFVTAFRDTYYVTPDDVEEVEILLDLMGVPHVTAPHEADPVCVYLTTLRQDGERLVKGVCSDDTDMIPLGSPFVFRQMSGNLRHSSKVEVVRTSHVIREMGLETRERLVDLCVLLGTDYNTNIFRVGPKTSISLLHKGLGLEEIMELKKASEEQKSAMRAAKEYIMTEPQRAKKAREYRPVREYVRTRGLDLQYMNRAGLAEFLVRKHNFDLDKVVDYLDQYEVALDTLGVEKK